MIEIKNIIRGWDFSDEDIAKAVSTNEVMLNPSIELTNTCNLNCPYCFIEEKNSTRKTRKIDELSFKETIKVIDDLKSLKAKTINIVGAGEPTIDPHFEEVVKYIYNSGMTTVLFTNGIKFSDNPLLVEFCYLNDVSIVLKYNSQSSLIQDFVSGRKGYTVKRDNALKLFFQSGFNATTPTRLGIDTIVFRGNIAEIPILHKWSRDNNIFPISAEYIPTGRTENGEFIGFESIRGFRYEEVKEISFLLLPVNSFERELLVSTIQEIDKSLNITRNENSAYYGGGNCSQILGLYIDIEGNIWPCVARAMKNGKKLVSGKMGNVRQGNLPSEIWVNHPYMQKIRTNYNGGCPYKPSPTFL
jgi:MoaA/NifB/PqqE/SkfB family radical SAM enzyme